MKYSLLAASILAEGVLSFLFVSEMPGVDSSIFSGARRAKRQQITNGPGSGCHLSI